MVESNDQISFKFHTYILQNDSNMGEFRVTEFQSHYRDGNHVHLVQKSGLVFKNSEIFDRHI